MDDGGARHRALGDAGGGRRAEGATALDQPLRQGQDDRATVPGAGEQGHQPRGERRRGGARHRRGGPGRGVARVHADAHHVRRLHHAPRVTPPPAGARRVERLRLRRRRRGRVRAGQGRAHRRAPLPRAWTRRRAQRVESV